MFSVKAIFEPNYERYEGVRPINIYLSRLRHTLLLLGPVISTTLLGMLYAGIYLLGKRSLTPVIASHTITDVIIEPWLPLAALSKAL